MSKPQEVVVVPQPEVERGPGIYSSVKPDPTTLKRLTEWMEKAGIPNPVPADKLHSTIVYSREAFAGYKPRTAITVVAPKMADEWGFVYGQYSLRRMGPEKEAIALCFQSGDLDSQFYQAMSLGATWDHDDCTRHITLSYNAPDFDFTKLDVPDFEMVFEPEVVEPLADDWSATLKFDFEAEICKVDEEQRIVYGWASVIEENGIPVIDHHGDVIESRELEKAAYDYMLDSRRGHDMHATAMGDEPVAKIVASIVFTKEVQKTLGIDLGKVGWFIGFKVYNDEVWKGVKSGQYKDFSIGGRAFREPIA